jgi:hypothetical protein
MNHIEREHHSGTPASGQDSRVPAFGQQETVANLPPMSVDDPFADALLAAGLIQELRLLIPRSWPAIT